MWYPWETSIGDPQSGQARVGKQGMAAEWMAALKRNNSTVNNSKVTGNIVNMDTSWRFDGESMDNHYTIAGKSPFA